MLRSEFIQSAALHRKRTLVALGIGVLLIAIYLAILLPYLDRVTCFIEGRFASTTSEILKGLLLSPAVLLLFASILASDRKDRQDTNLKCPVCTKPLTEVSFLVIATSNCPHCGERIIDANVRE